MITFGSIVAAGLPMLTALIGVGTGLAGILWTSSVVEMSNTAPILALMLGLAVGIDYALFIVSRHRNQVLAGMPITESIARATGTAGTAVVFAGLTVLIALAGLSVVGIPFLTVMGLAAAATVAISVIIAITLLPALLGFAGEKVLRKKDRAGGGRAARGHRRPARRARSFRFAEPVDPDDHQAAGAGADRRRLSGWASSPSRPRRCSSACRTTAPPSRTPPSARLTT